MDEELFGNLTVEASHKLTQFKEYAISHPHLIKIDQALMRAIVEPAGFAHVLVYGPSGVGKTTMINRLGKRLNGIDSQKNSFLEKGTIPLLLLETRPSDDGVFNRADYYRTALKKLGEPFYERRLLVDINTEQTWEKKGRGRTKNAQFNDSPELRQALEDALVKRGVRTVILDEAQHLMKVGNGQSAGKLLDQLDWIKSITNVTGVLHILIGTYELLNFQNLSGQTARRCLDLHFPRYQFTNEQDTLDFQGILLALLKEVPLNADIESLMQQWFYFYERSIGCVGVLKEWLVRACAATFHEGEDTLTLQRIQENALSLAQCERMAIDAVEGEQKLTYSASRQEHLSRLLKMEGALTESASKFPTTESIDSQRTSSETKNKGRKRTPSASSNKSVDKDDTTVAPTSSTPTVKKGRKKATSPKKDEIVPLPSLNEATLTDSTNVEPDSNDVPSTQKKTKRRVGARKPKRDQVGSEPEKP